MRFEYYDRLGAKDRRTYRKSDAVSAIELPSHAVRALRALAKETEAALATEKPRSVSAPVKKLVSGLCEALEAPALEVKVRARRPRSAEGELHGLYTRWEDGTARIEVWMKTAAHAKTVKPRPFVRTLLHEVCHHLDYTVLGLADSFHTEGFFKRESSLVRALLPAPKKKPIQLSLFSLAESGPSRTKRS